MLPYSADFKRTICMATNWAIYSLQELRLHSKHAFRKGGGTRPDVLLIEVDGEAAVLKDHSASDRWFSTLIGPLLTWRECKALQRLEAVECIPKLLARPSKRSFLMTYHPAVPITMPEAATHDWDTIFARLSAALQQVHEAGVAHNDLRNPSNTLITADGEPVLVDLVGAFFRGHSWNLLNHWVFDKFCLVDKSAITKMKQTFAPELLSSADVQPEQIAGPAGMFVRRAGQWIRSLSQKLFTDNK